MYSFRIISFFVYTFAHAYLFYKLYAAYGKKKWLAGVGLFFILILLAWFFRRSFPATSFEAWGVPVMYTWLGFLFITLPWLIFSDICRFLCRLFDHFTGKKWADFTTSRRTLPIVLFFSLCLSLYGVWSAFHPQIRFVDFPTEKLPEGIDRIRIVQLSDIHLGPLARTPFLKRILASVDKLHPDILAFTGDIVDSNMRDRAHDADLMRNTRAKFGNFAITGNHEVLVGLGQSLDFIKKAGIQVLMGEKITAAGIEIIGIDDPIVATRSTWGKTPDLAELLRDAPYDTFRLVLAHRPEIDPECTGLFDLQLSGHTHNGQIWPGNLVMRYIVGNPAPGFSFYEGKHGKSALYLNPGTGFWGPPMRLWAPAEITVINLVRP